MDKKFGFEKLDVYQQGLEFVNLCFNLTKEFDNKIQFSLGDQLRRASLSIVTNIAEGVGRKHEKEKKQFFQTSLASCFECVAILTICTNQKQINEEKFNDFYERCYSISKMLSKLIKSVNKFNN
ncbi:MAG: four helix bundle protein [Armatimonadetes bacterium]|nr:four helix bundle protein [Armatimonadota bacterium]